MTMMKRAGLMSKIDDRKGSCLPASVEAEPFNFDELAKEVARGLSRREALKLAFTGLAGAAMASLGIKTTWAASGNCTAQVQAPSTDYVCTASPWQGFGGVDFQCCCVQHDYCFSTCGSSFDRCNLSFYQCLVGQCQALQGTERLQCETVALLMYQGVSTNYPDSPLLPLSGYSRYLESQSDVCGCSCPDGTVCRNREMCSPSGTGCVACDNCTGKVSPCA
jgi:hypothetical protein